jgi:hypothetical protein
MKEPAGVQGIYSFVVVPCDEPHDREVFASFSLSGSSGSEFPGAATVERRSFDGCDERFADYVGAPFQSFGTRRDGNHALCRVVVRGRPRCGLLDDAPGR